MNWIRRNGYYLFLVAWVGVIGWLLFTGRMRM